MKSLTRKNEQVTQIYWNRYHNDILHDFFLFRNIFSFFVFFFFISFVRLLFLTTFTSNRLFTRWLHSWKRVEAPSQIEKKMKVFSSSSAKSWNNKARNNQPLTIVLFSHFSYSSPLEKFMLKFRRIDTCIILSKQNRKWWEPEMQANVNTFHLSYVELCSAPLKMKQESLNRTEENICHHSPSITEFWDFFRAENRFWIQFLPFNQFKCKQWMFKLNWITHAFFNQIVWQRFILRWHEAPHMTWRTWKQDYS